MKPISPALSRQFPDLDQFIQNIKELAEGGFFIKGQEIFVNRTPGRLDLMGGNDDYTGGFVFEKTIREATFVAVQARQDEQVVFLNLQVRLQGWDERIEFSLWDLINGKGLKTLDEIRNWVHANEKRAWGAYILGDLYFLMQKYPEKVSRGFSLFLSSDIPLGKGVSSSAALEVAPMKAIAALYGIEVSGVELASWTQWVEIALTQSACGIMDQLTVVTGDEDHFVPMRCQPCIPYPLVKLPESLYVWGIDSGIRHAVSGIEYEAARAATFMGYRYLCEIEGLEPTLDESGALARWVDPLWNGYLANVSPSVFHSQYEAHLPENISGEEFKARFSEHLDPFTTVHPNICYPVRGATRYAVEENWRVECFYSLISAPSALRNEIVFDLLGELMYQSHYGYSECGLGSAETDQIISFARAQRKNGILGAKITGGGAGGTVAVLGFNTTRAKNAFLDVVKSYQKWSDKEPYIFEGSSAGCDAFGVLEMTIS